MRIVALLFALLASACAKPVPKAAPPRPDCFAPAGFYIMFAGLAGHNCRWQPKETIMAGLEAKADSLPCGIHRRQAPIGKGGGVLSMVVSASRSGIEGRMEARFPDCVATYEAVYLRMR